ncbi:hypothetical protein CSB11_00190 [Candidatus Campbellbacteria bacterium]|nr:MAG: hypothetical protein CSB11_00190 [Candidatus Campbellbacteria bacterium]
MSNYNEFNIEVDNLNDLIISLELEADIISQLGKKIDAKRICLLLNLVYEDFLGNGNKIFLDEYKNLSMEDINTCKMILRIVAEKIQSTEYLKERGLTLDENNHDTIIMYAFNQVIAHSKNK